MDLPKEDAAFLQHALLVIENHYKQRAEQLENEVLSLKKSKALDVIDRAIWKGRFTFLEENTSRIIRNHQLELGNRADQIELLMRDVSRLTQINARAKSEQGTPPKLTSESAPQSPTSPSRRHDDSTTLIHTREKQLERLATQLDNTNGSLERTTKVLEEMQVKMHELEFKNAELTHALNQERLNNERLRRQCMTNEKNIGFKKLLSAAALPMSLAAGGQGRSAHERAVLQFLADLRTEVAMIGGGTVDDGGSEEKEEEARDSDSR